MSPRAGLSTETVVDLALAVLDDEGADALTLAKVAERAGVASPSLYKHVGGLPALRRLADLRVLAEMTDALRTAGVGRSGEDAVGAALDAYRDYLRRYPHRASALEAAPDPGDQDLSDAAHGVAEVVFALLRPYGYDDEQVVHATRCLRAAVHGFSGLEAAGGFGRPQDIDTSFELLKSMITHGLTKLQNT
jgi:AcrR family transcriptional regulator